MGGRVDGRCDARGVVRRGTGASRAQPAHRLACSLDHGNAFCGRRGRRRGGSIAVLDIRRVEAGRLRIAGNDAFIEDSTALGSNSALTGLTSIGAGANFGSGERGGGVDDRIGHQQRRVDKIRQYYELGRLDPVDRRRADQHRHAQYRQQRSSYSVTAKSFVNSGGVDLSGADVATIDVSGTTDQQWRDFHRLRH